MEGVGHGVTKENPHQDLNSCAGQPVSLLAMQELWTPWEGVGEPSEVLSLSLTTGLGSREGGLSQAG